MPKQEAHKHAVEELAFQLAFGYIDCSPPHGKIKCAGSTLYARFIPTLEVGNWVAKLVLPILHEGHVTVLDKIQAIDLGL